MLQELTERCIPVQYSSLPSSSATAGLRPSLTRDHMDSATPGALSDSTGLEGPCSEMWEWKESRVDPCFPAGLALINAHTW